MQQSFAVRLHKRCVDWVVSFSSLGQSLMLLPSLICLLWMTCLWEVVTQSLNRSFFLESVCCQQHNLLQPKGEAKLHGRVGKPQIEAEWFYSEGGCMVAMTTSSWPRSLTSWFMLVKCLGASGSFKQAWLFGSFWPLCTSKLDNKEKTNGFLLFQVQP